MSRLVPCSLKLIVPLVLLGFAAALSLLNVVYHAPLAQRAVEEDDRERLFQDLSRLESSLEYLLLKGDIEGAQREVVILAFNHDYKVAVLADDLGIVVAATRRAWLGRRATEVLQDFDHVEAAQAAGARHARIATSPDGTSLLAYAGVQLGSSAHELRSSRVGRLYLEYDMRRSKAKALQNITSQSIYWSACVTGLALVLWIAFHFLLTRRTERLVRAAEQIASGNLAARSALAGRDELARLSRAFDAMAQQVGDNQTRLREDIDARAKVEEKLRASEASYRAIFDAVEDGIFVFDIDSGAMVDVNLKACDAYGYSKEEMLQIDLTTLNADTRAYTKKDVTKLIRRAAAGEELHFEWHRMSKDGSLHWDEIILNRVTIGGQDRILVLARDVTEKKRATEELSLHREKLYQREKLAALGSLLASVAHELNNPLSVVVARAVMLEEKGDPATYSVAIKIRTAAERCARIVRTFLAMARQQPPQRVPVKINSVIHAALELTGYALRTSGVEVELDLDENVRPILADADQVHQVLMNLIVNAQQALQDHPAPRRVYLTSRYEIPANKVLITVADNGPGIPESMRARIFEPYFTTKPTGSGIGVGLSVSAGIVESLGGTLTFDCPHAGGTEFRITLPAGAANQVDTSKRGVIDQDGVTRSILVVDDEVEVRHALGDILERAGHKVAIAASGQEALERLASVSYDVIVTDMRMPDLDGRALYEEIERRWPEQSSRVIFVTGDTLTKTLREYAKECGRPVIEKPFLPSDVRRIVAETAQGSKSGKWAPSQ